MRRELRDFVRETLLASDAAWRAYLRPGPVEKLLDSHEQGQNVSKEVFSLLVLELWHQRFVKGLTPIPLHDASSGAYATRVGDQQS